MDLYTVNFGLWELLFILIIVGLLFITTRICDLRGNLGNMLRDLRSDMKGNNEDEHMAIHTLDKNNDNSYDK